MNRRTRTLITAAASLVLAGSAGLAQNQDRPNSEANQPERSPSARSAVESSADRQLTDELRQIAADPKTAPDKLFALQAGLGNQFEIQFAQRIEQKAQNAQVKQAARQIVQDHQKANEKLQQVARQLQVNLPQSLPESKQQIIQIITSLPVDQMEKQYIAMMEADHAMAVSMYRSCAATSENQPLKDYAESELPTLHKHDELLDQAAIALKIPGRANEEAEPAAGHIPGRMDTQRRQ